MTISSTKNKEPYSNATSPFPIPFLFFSEDDIVAIKRSSDGSESTLTLTTDYTLSGFNSSSESLTLTSTTTDPSADETLLIKRVEQFTQPDDLPTAGALPSATVEQMVDRVTMLCQQMDEQMARVPVLPQTSTASALTFPEPSANQLLGWNSGGTALENKTLANLSSTSITVSAFIETLLDDADGAAARTTLGAGTGNLVDDTTPQLGGTLDANSKQIRWAKGADVASANALTLGTDGNYFDITGTTTITSIGTLAVGTVVKLHFDGALTLTHQATDLILPGAANITTAAGDEVEFVEYATADWRCTNYSIAVNAPGGGDTTERQDFTSSGTWTKPSIGTFALVEAWGAGASGGASRTNSDGAGGGGAGGGYVSSLFLLSDLGATETVTVGAGGVAISASQTAGNAGGNTTFGSKVTAYGGGAGEGAAGAQSGGGGGGQLAVGGNASGATGGTGGGALGGAGGTDADGADGNSGGGAGGATQPDGGDGIFGGGGGGSSGSATNVGGTGGASIYGGGGGGGGSNESAASGGVGGTSTRGGNGGASGFQGSDGVAGTQPGGGGGAGSSGTSDSGAGAAGKVTVYVW